VQLEAQGALVAPFDGVPVLLDRRPLTSAAFWRPGQQISVGGTLLDLAPYEPRTPRCTPQKTAAAWSSTGRAAPAPGQAARFALPGRPQNPSGGRSRS